MQTTTSKTKVSPSVAIIILNWNSFDDTHECIKSLDKLAYENFNIFLVDNDSTDGSYNRLKENDQNGLYKTKIIFIQSGGNLGFAGGNNVGIKKALEHGHKYFWLLNNDTIVHENALKILITEISSNETIGIVGSKIYYHGSAKIWFAGGQINQYTCAPKHIGIGEKDSPKYNRIMEVDYITGCSLLFKKEVLDSIGFMSEDYFLYFEETDWNIRAKQNGWSIRYVPDSIVFHKVSISSGGENNLAPYVDFYQLRNMIAMVLRTQKGLIKLISVINIFFILLKKLIKIFLRNQNRKKERVIYLLKAINNGFRQKMGSI